MKYKTIREIAAELNLSKTAVRNFMAEIENFRNLYTEKTENGMILIDENGANLLKKRAETSEKHFAESCGNNKKQAETSEKHFAETEKFQFFIEQLREKDKQIQNLQNLLNQEQLLHAQDLKRLGGTVEEENTTETAEKVRKWWEFWKK